MPTQKSQNHNIRKLSKVAGGNSFSITLPIEYVRKLKWKEKQKLVVELKARHLIIKDWKNSPARQKQIQKARADSSPDPSSARTKSKNKLVSVLRKSKPPEKIVFAKPSPH